MYMILSFFGPDDGRTSNSVQNFMSLCLIVPCIDFVRRNNYFASRIVIDNNVEPIDFTRNCCFRSNFIEATC